MLEGLPSVESFGMFLPISSAPFQVKEHGAPLSTPSGSIGTKKCKESPTKDITPTYFNSFCISFSLFSSSSSILPDREKTRVKGQEE